MSRKNKINRIRSSFSTPAANTEFNPDYTYVRRDLTRIGILAGIFFAGLFVLSFFIK